MTKKLANIHKL